MLIYHLHRAFSVCRQYARVVELADSLDSGSSVHYARAGSSPASRTKKKDTTFVVSFFLGFAGQRRLPPFGLKCSEEMNSACAEVLPAAKRSYGAEAPLARRPVGRFCFFVSLL